MKYLIPSLVVAILVAGQTGALAQNTLEDDPGYLGIDKAIDLKVVRPEVNVNLPKFLLKDAASSLNGGPNDPFAGTGINFADLIKDIKLIRVLVIESAEANRGALEKGMKALHAELAAKWTPIVTVPEGEVGIYMRGDATGESMAGLALVIDDKDDAVIANVVGKVSLGKIIQIASRLDKFPKDLLKKLAAPAAGLEQKSEDAAEEKETSSPAE